MKKIKFAAFATALVLLVGTAVVYARTIDVSDKLTLTINGEVVSGDSNGSVEPFIYEGTAYAPIRAIAENLGIDIEWIQESGTVAVTEPESEFVLPDGLTLTEDGTLGDLLVVVDMQNVYLEGQPWACTRTSLCAENIIKLIDCVDNVVFTEYLAPENPTGCWVDYNELYADINSNEWYNAVLDSLQPYTDIYPVYDKSTYSSYGNEDFKHLTLKADRVIITGVMSECCILATVVDAIDTGVPLVYITDACSGSTEEYEKQTESIVSFASPLHTLLMTTDEYIASKSE